MHSTRDSQFLFHCDGELIQARRIHVRREAAHLTQRRYAHACDFSIIALLCHHLSENGELNSEVFRVRSHKVSIATSCLAVIVEKRSHASLRLRYHRQLRVEDTELTQPSRDDVRIQFNAADERRDDCSHRCDFVG